MSDETKAGRNPPHGPAKRQPGEKASASAEAADKAAQRAARKEAKRLSRESPGALTVFFQRRTAGLMRFVFAWARHVGRERASRIAGRVARFIAPLARENKVGAANIAAAFPAMSDEERARLLASVWDNVARQMIDYAFIREMVDSFDPEHPFDGSIIFEGLEHAVRLRESGKGSLMFGAHIGNWELPGMIGARIGMPISGLYRPPANPYVAAEIEAVRAGYYDRLIASGQGAMLQVAKALARGSQIGVIVDQRISEGQILPFFGRQSASNPIIGLLASRFDVPVLGVHTVRLPDGRFRMIMTPPLDLPRDAAGRVDAEGTNIVVHSMIEQWIRETPEQWLWLHDRWRTGRRKHGRQF